MIAGSAAAPRLAGFDASEIAAEEDFASNSIAGDRDATKEPRVACARLRDDASTYSQRQNYSDVCMFNMSNDTEFNYSLN